MITNACRWMVLFSAMTLLQGCGAMWDTLVSPPNEFVEIERYTVPKPVGSGKFLAGTGRADITPPPGFPTGGHGPAGNLVRGQWTRLYARAFFFEDRAGNTLVMVSCELFAVPDGLQSFVARDIALQWAPQGISIPPEAIILAATHTHQGPGNFMTAPLYNEHASNYPGFSREMFDFLRTQIVAAISKAVENAHSGSAAVELRLHAGKMPDTILLNRSPQVFTLNWDRDEIMNTLNGVNLPGNQECSKAWKEGEPKDGWDLPGCPRLRAVDRQLVVLDVRKGGQTIGLLVFLAVHPTVLIHDAPLYSSDFMGVAVRILEGDQKRALSPVVGFFNGAEGDVVPRRTGRDLQDVMSIGKTVAQVVKEVTQKEGERLDLPDSIEVRRRVIHTDRDSDKVCDQFKLGNVPVFGAAALGGAEGDRTILYELGWREGVRDRSRDGQGPKLPALDSQLVRTLRFTNFQAPPEKFPLTIPLTFVSMGQFYLAAIPVEMSTAQLFRIRKGLKLPSERFRIIGLANNYVSYTATPEEYVAQDYMGASTIWGPQEGPFLGCILDQILDQIRKAPREPLPRTIDKQEFSVGSRPRVPFGVDFVGDRRLLPDEELEKVLIKSKLPARDLPFFQWEEIAPKGSNDFDGNKLRSYDPRVEMLEYRGETWVVRNDGQFLDDDTGFNFLTMALGRSETGKLSGGDEDSARNWAAIWLAPLFLTPEESLDTEFVFRVSVKGKEHCSQPFRIGSRKGQPPKPELKAEKCPQATR